MASRREVEKMIQVYMAEAVPIEERLMEIVCDLSNERDALRVQVNKLQRKVDEYEQGKSSEVGMYFFE